MFHYFFVCSMVVYMEIIVPLSWLFKQSGPAQACKGNFSRHSHLLVPSRSAQWDNGHFTCMQLPAWRPVPYPLSLSPPRGTGTTQTKVVAGPRRDKTLSRNYAALNILCASTEAKPRGRRSQQLAPRCTSYVTGQFAGSC